MSIPIYLRIDDFPAWIESMEQFVPLADFERFHAILESHGIPYMLAVTPQAACRPLNPKDSETRRLTSEECNVLRRIAVNDATIGLHGTTHRSRVERPHSEFVGLEDFEFEDRIAYGALELQRMTGMRPEVFVPPFNRISRTQLDLLGRRFAVVCGGPESVPTIGQVDSFRLSPTSLYFPSYPPFYGRAYELLTALDQIRSGPVCLTLHWEWELRRGFNELDRLCGALENRVRPWDELIYVHAA